MPRPLNQSERFVVAYVRSGRWKHAAYAWAAGDAIAAALFVYGVAANDRALIVTGFGTLLFLSVYSKLGQPHFTRSLASALEKLQDDDPADGAGGG